MSVKLIDLEWDKEIGCAILEWLHLVNQEEDEKTDEAMRRIDEIEQSLESIERQVIRIRMLRAQTSAERTRDDRPMRKKGTVWNG